MFNNIRFSFKSFGFLLLAVALIWVRPTLGAFSYPGCTDLAASDFRQVILVGRGVTPNGTTILANDAALTEPVSIYVKPDGKVFWAERFTGGNSGAQTGFGHVKMFDPSNNSVTQILNMPVAAGVGSGQSGNSELGLRFFTLHPNFAANHWGYMYYMPRTSATNAGTDSMRVSRFNLDPTTYMVDATSEKVILSMPWTPGICCHQGGGMDWDNHGNLFITTGNNTLNSTGFAPMLTTFGTGTPRGADKDMATNDNQARAANTMDWRGKLLRIHPDSSAKGYSIPAGNLRNVFFQIGGAWVAGQDTNKILPEIYSFGTRNAYTVSVDSVTGWAMVGTVGNDQTSWTTSTTGAAAGPAGNDEFDINTKPQFNGWPYFVGRPRINPVTHLDSGAYNMYNPATTNYSLPPQSIDTVYNNSPNNTGVTHLPPATPCALPESKQVSVNTGIMAPFSEGTTSTSTMATTGPIYHYNSYPASAGKKWPPHLDGKWIVAESAKNRVFVATPNSAGTAVTDLQRIPGDGTAFTPTNTGVIDMKFGPEGALYIAYYNAGFFATTANTRITRVEYTGSCVVGQVSLLTNERKKNVLMQGIFYANMNSRLTWPEGMHTAEVFNLQGKMVWSGERMASEVSTELPSNLKSGVLQVRFKP